MKSISVPAFRTLAALTLLAALIVAISMASGSTPVQAHSQIEPDDHGLPNYDVRLDHSRDGASIRATVRSSAAKAESEVSDIRSRIAEGEQSLKERNPGVIIEYSERLGNVEVISPDVWKETADAIAPEANGDRVGALRGFLKNNSNLVGLDPVGVDALKVAADYTNPDGVLSFTHLEQYVNGVPVFAGEVKAGFDQSGRMIRVINNLAPGIGEGFVSGDFGDATDAVRAAMSHLGKSDLKADAVNTRASTDLRIVFGDGGDWATTAEKMYFPTEPGVVVPSWRVLVWEPADAYYVVVDAKTGSMLWRKNISEDQTQPATFNVYRNANAYIDVADSPAPFTPGPMSPNGAQAAVIARENITLIGNEGDLSFNNLGWVTDGTNITDGNSNQAGIDRSGSNGVDAPQTGSPTRVFTSTWNPPPGNPGPGDSPLTAQAQRGAVIQMFYVMNRYHDELYKLGFTEAARNFQNNNFGRGGAASDRISSEGQDISGTNNANFATPADGGRGRMQMYIWTGPNPDYDGTADADIIIHEVTHGTSNRLHGNSTGLSTNMSRGMGEGWGDFYGHAMLAEASDPINSIYTTGGYATYLGTTNFTSNYYYGIRRFPKAVIAFTGPNGKPHNPLTFRHLNSNCNTGINTIGAFARGPFGSSTCDQVHNAGEIWSSALWEVRSLMVERMGFTAGTRRVLQVVTDGMKLSPTGPTFLQARDAIISAALNYSAADADDVREGFRRRGMGYSASIQSTSPASVTEAFDSWPGGNPTPTPTPTPTPEPTPTPSPTATPTPTPPPSGITLSVVTRKEKGIWVADLSWSGASGTSVDYYRDSTKFSTLNDGFHSDNTGQRGSGSITYRVCLTGSTTECSNSVTATW